MTRMEKHLKTFGTAKPLIGCLHLSALPGTYMYDDSYSMEEHIAAVREDARILQELGYDAVVFANEADYPYVDAVGPEIVAAYARIVTEVKQDLKVPFGVGIMMDSFASVGLAKAVGASFVRGNFSNTHTTDFGILNERTGEIFRYAKHIGAEDLSIYTSIEGHYGEVLDPRPVEEKFKSVSFIVPVAGFIMSGAITGQSPDPEKLARLKKMDDTVPMILNSGAKAENIASFLPWCDGVIVGTSLKKDGNLWNHIDYDRAAAFIEAARKA